MYHGDKVPGFPAHPHRGFETVTVVRQGLIDHADSLGAAGRYGGGDLQWMTAGAGIQHSEMFPLINSVGGNTLELFQIWLNLSRANKMVEPHYEMFWHEEIPVVSPRDGAVRVDVLAGIFGGTDSLSPPPDSWAAKPENQVAIWLVTLNEGAEFKLPAGEPGLTRMLYFYEGDQVTVSGNEISRKSAVELDSSRPVLLKAHHKPAQFLMLQGKPIGEPVVAHGPFVMNTREEIVNAIHDYQATRFGGWPWDRDDVVHGNDQSRFAKYADGSVETPPSKKV